MDLHKNPALLITARRDFKQYLLLMPYRRYTYGRTPAIRYVPIVIVYLISGRYSHTGTIVLSLVPNNLMYWYRHAIPFYPPTALLTAGRFNPVPGNSYWSN